MGDMADAIINGDFDEITGEWIGLGQGFPRTLEGYKTGRTKETPIEKRIRATRRELAILIAEKHKTCTTEQQRNHAVGLARQEINLKYGKGWRDGDFK